MKIASELRGRRTLISAVITTVVVLTLVLSGAGISANSGYPYGDSSYGSDYGYGPTVEATVPAFTPAGLTALIGLLTAIAVISIGIGKRQ